MVRFLSKKATQIPAIDFTIQVWKEGSTYVGYAPELDISSCGDTVAQARSHLREAASLFLEECAKEGTLDSILAESGFEKRGLRYRPRRIIARAKVRVAIPLAS
jgi:predicted RNase H-like HicB family nuclease